ncbi:MAG: formyltransferase family protein [Planctomycetota bacterium]
MRLAILCQEEPVFLGPFLRRVIAAHPARVAAVFLAGRRSAGERTATAVQRRRSLRILWGIMEPSGFLSALALRLRARLLGSRDPRSVEGLARQLGLSVHRVADPNSGEFHRRLRELAPDAVLNQSERLLKREVLSIPRLGFVNRHASLLPAFRGRMACWRSHAAESPRYGVTIHVVDEGVDTGPIILQQEFADADPRRSYPRVMRHVCAGAPELFWRAMELLESEGFTPATQPREGEVFAFPTLEEVREYRGRLAARRGKG